MGQKLKIPLQPRGRHLRLPEARQRRRAVRKHHAGTLRAPGCFTCAAVSLGREECEVFGGWGVRGGADERLPRRSGRRESSDERRRRRYGQEKQEEAIVNGEHLVLPYPTGSFKLK